MQPFFRKSLPMPNVCADIDDEDGTTYSQCFNTEITSEETKEHEGVNGHIFWEYTIRRLICKKNRNGLGHT